MITKVSAMCKGLKEIINLNLLFPPVCQHCGDRIDKSDDYLCDSCSEKLMLLEPNLCPYCGKKMVRGECFDCGRPEEPWTEAQAIFAYRDSLRALIHSLKYDGKRGIAKFLAKKTSEWLQQNRIFTDANLILPIPLHRVRLKERGFNQSAIISKYIAKMQNWSFSDSSLIRNRATTKQSKVADHERAMNVHNAFSVKKPELILSNNVVLLDDIFTSGSTMREVCNVVNKCNPKRLYVLTIGKVC